MIETETPAERRLRELAEWTDVITGDRGKAEIAAIDMGREALALLREPADDPGEWIRKVRALLARAGEE